MESASAKASFFLRLRFSVHHLLDIAQNRVYDPMTVTMSRHQVSAKAVFGTEPDQSGVIGSSFPAKLRRILCQWGA